MHYFLPIIIFRPIYVTYYYLTKEYKTTQQYAMCRLPFMKQELISKYFYLHKAWNFNLRNLSSNEHYDVPKLIIETIQLNTYVSYVQLYNDKVLSNKLTHCKNNIKSPLDRIRLTTNCFTYLVQPWKKWTWFLCVCVNCAFFLTITI